MVLSSIHRKVVLLFIALHTFWRILESQSYNDFRPTIKRTEQFQRKQQIIKLIEEIINSDDGANRADKKSETFYSGDDSLKELNDFLMGLEFVLGDIELKLSELASGVPIPLPFTPDTKLTLSNLTFGNNGVQDINDKASLVIITDISDDKYIYNLELVGLSTLISANYHAQVSDTGPLDFIKLEGKFEIELVDTRIDVDIALLSENFDTYPPSRAMSDRCSPTVVISNIKFSGFLLQIFEGFIFQFRKALGNFFGDILCSQVELVILNSLSKPLGSLEELVMPYLLKEVTNDDDLPLLPTFNLPTKVQSGFIDFLDTSSSVGNAINLIVSNIDKYLSAETEDIDTGRTDLGINILLRSLVLNEQTNAFTYGVEHQIFDHNLFGVNASVALIETSVWGLDKFTVFKPLRVLSQTLSTELELPSITFKLKLGVKFHNDAKMTQSDEFLVFLGKEHYEEFTMDFSFEDLYVNASGTFLLDSEILYNIALGSFFNVSNVLPCTLVSMDLFEVKELKPSLTVNALKIDRFIDPKIGLLLTNLFAAMTNMSYSVISDAFPIYISTTGRDTLNRITREAIENVTANECAIFKSSGEAILDLRDFLLSPEDAFSKGATGSSPYGDLTPFVKIAIDEDLVSEDEYGHPKLSSTIASLTEGSSGEVGLLKFAPNFACTQNVLNMPIDFHFKNFTVENIDNIIYPFEILEPKGPHLIHNRITIGTPSRPLRSEWEFSFSSVKNGVTFEDQFKLSTAYSRVEMVAGIVLMVKEEEFMQYPMSNLPILSCWLALFKTTDEGRSGFYVEDLDINLDLEIFSLDCVKCSRLNRLPELFAVLENRNAYSIILEKAMYLGIEYLKLEPLEILYDYIIDADKSCPSHPNYNATYFTIDLPELIATILGGEDTGQCIGGSDPADNDVGSSASVSGDDGGDSSNKDEGSGSSQLQLIDGPYKKEFMESLLFLSSIGLSVIKGGFPIFASYFLSPETYISNDPLSQQKQYTSTSAGNKLLDISNLNSTFLNFLVVPMQFANDTIANVVDDPLSHDGKNIGANIYIRGLLDENSVLTIPVEYNLFDMVTVESLELSGLDTFLDLNPIEFIGPQTFQSRFNLKFLKVKINLSVFFHDNFDVDKAERQSMSINVGFRDIIFDGAVYLGIIEETLKNLKMGSLLFMNQILNCFLSVVENISITKLVVSIGDFDGLKIDGFLPHDLRLLLMNVDKDIALLFEQDLIKALPTIFDNFVRVQLNSFLKKYSQEVKCEMLFKPGKQFIDLRDLLLEPEISKQKGGRGDMPYGNIFSTVYSLVIKYLFGSNENGYSKLNDIIIHSITDSGTLKFDEPVVYQDLDLLDDMHFRGGGKLVVSALYNTRIDNLDTFGFPSVILYPEGAHILNNSFHFGAAENPVTLNTSVFVELESGGVVSSNNVNISLMLTTIGIDTLLRGYLSETYLMNFPFADVANVGCWLALFPPVQFDDYGVNNGKSISKLTIEDPKIQLENLILNVKCTACESAEFQNFVTDYASEDFDRALKGLLDSEFLQMRIDRAVYSGARQCPHRIEYEPNTTEAEFNPFKSPDSGAGEIMARTFKGLFLTLIIFTLVTSLSYRFVKIGVRRRHRKWLKSLGDFDISQLFKQYALEKERSLYVSEKTSAMMFSPDVPFVMRIIVPSVIVLNCFLFVNGHISVGATIDVVFTFANEPFKINGLYTYSIIDLIKDMWKVAVKALAVVVFLLSAVWPYFKQAFTFFLWVIPPRFVSVDSRGSILRTLDSLGKWSMIDIFLIVVAMSLFKITLKNSSRYPENYFAINLMMVPLWGLYANALAQIISQINSHFILYYHEKMKRNALRKYDNSLISTGVDDLELEELVLKMNKENDITIVNDDTEEKHNMSNGFENGSKKSVGKRGRIIPRLEEKAHENSFYGGTKMVTYALCDYRFDLSGPMSGCKSRVSAIGNKIFGFIGFLTCFFVVLGSSIKYLKVEITGVVASIIKVGQDGKPAENFFNVFSTAGGMINVGYFVGTTNAVVGTYCLAFLVLLTCFLVPLAQGVTVLIIWFKPMTQRVRDRLTLTLEILVAWQYVEVYFLGAIIMMWQAGTISSFLVYIICRGLNDFFGAAASTGLIEERDARCFLITASLKKGVAFHILSSAFLWWTTDFVQKALKQHAFDQDRKIMRKLLLVREETKDLSALLSRKEQVKSLRNVPIKFTDEFSWFMGRAIFVAKKKQNGENVSIS